MQKEKIISFAIPFRLNNQLNNEPFISEFNINFNPSKNSIDKLEEFSDLYKDKRINVFMGDAFSTKDAKNILALADNIFLRVQKDDLYKTDFKDFKGRFFFNGTYPAYSFAALWRLMSLGVSDVYPVDETLYDILKLNMSCKNNNVKTRCVLNRVLTYDSYKIAFNPKMHFIRPENLNTVRSFFDVFEFDCALDNSKYDFVKFNRLYRIYVQEGKWEGELSDIIQDIPNGISNPGILPYLFSSKFHCRMSCLHRKCNLCESSVKFSNFLRDKELKPVLKRKEDV